MSLSPRSSVIAITRCPASTYFLRSTDVSRPPEQARTIVDTRRLSDSRVGLHIFEALHDDGEVFRLVDDHEDRIVAADRPEDVRPLGGVDRRGQHHGTPGRRVEDDVVEAPFDARHELGDEAVQTARIVLAAPDSGLDVFELLGLSVSVLQRNLHQAEFFDVARNSRLRHLVALLFEQMLELFLRMDGASRDQREDRPLPYGLLHPTGAPSRALRPFQAMLGAMRGCRSFNEALQIGE